jgi:hypothetical protein
MLATRATIPMVVASDGLFVSNAADYMRLGPIATYDPAGFERATLMFPCDIVFGFGFRLSVARVLWGA